MVLELPVPVIERVLRPVGVLPQPGRLVARQLERPGHQLIGSHDGALVRATVRSEIPARGFRCRRWSCRRDRLPRGTVIVRRKGARRKAACRRASADQHRQDQSGGTHSVMGASRARRHSETPRSGCGTRARILLRDGSPRGRRARLARASRGRSWRTVTVLPEPAGQGMAHPARTRRVRDRTHQLALATSTSAAARGARHRRWARDGGRTRARPFLRADDLQRRPADGPDRPGGDLRPVLSVIPVADYQEAVTALNQTRYGLSSSIYTRDVNTAFRAMRDFETGIVYVNAGTTGAERTAARRLEGDRQRPSRGRPRRARHIHRVEGDLRRLQRPPAAGADRQPVIEPRDGRTHRSDEG